MHYKIEIEKIENSSKFMDSENPVQSLAYSQIKTALGEPFLLVASIDGRTVSTWLGFYRKTLGVFPMVTFNSEPSNQDSELVEAFIQKVIKHFRPFKIDFLSLTLSRFENREILEKLKFNIIEYSSNLVDLTSSEDDIFTGINSKHRNSIRKASSEDVLFYEDTSLVGINTFHSIAKETYQRSGMQNLNLDYLIQHFNALSPVANLNIFFVKKNEDVQAAAIIIRNNKFAIYWHGASINGPSQGAANFLHWSIIKDLKVKGVKTYDFGGHPPSTDLSEKGSSIKRFKIRFGGIEKKYYGGYLILKPINNALFEFLKYLNSLISKIKPR